MKKLMLSACALALLTACDNGNQVVDNIPYGYVGVQDDGTILYSGDYYDLRENPSIYRTWWYQHTTIPCAEGPEHVDEIIVRIQVFVPNERIEHYVNEFDGALLPDQQTMSTHLQSWIMDNGWTCAYRRVRQGPMTFNRWDRPSDMPSSISIDEIM